MRALNIAALYVPCPYCGAQPEQPCCSIASGKLLHSSAHADRRAAARLARWRWLRMRNQWLRMRNRR